MKISVLVKVFYVLVMAAFMLACQPKTEFEKRKEKELASGKVVEDLFLDIKFGMDRKEFFGTCWEWNKKGVLTNGSHYLQVLYKPEVSSGKEVNMHFYPSFEEGQLFFMPIEFSYPAWFPGNEEYEVDKLMTDVVDLMQSWYGDVFFEVSNKNKTVKAMVSVDGNRLIRIFKKDMTSVRVEMLDLRVKDISDMINKEDEA